MHTEFKEVITQFYHIVSSKTQLSQVFRHSLERYLNYIELEQSKNKDKNIDSQEIKSLRSGNSSLSSDSYHKIKKLFHSNRIETAILFTYFLQTIKTKKDEQLAFVLQKIPQKLLATKKKITNQEKKRFQAKFLKLSDQLIILSERLKAGFKIDWLYYEIFTQFESESLLTIQLLSSKGEELQSLQNIKTGQYATFLQMLKVKCHLFDKKTKQSKIFGSGGIKIYLCKKVEESYSILTEKQFELQLRLSKKDGLSGQKISEAIDSQNVELKKYPVIKFKQNFFADIMKLKQDYEGNTEKIANLFSFKDSNDQKRVVDQSRQA